MSFILYSLFVHKDYTLNEPSFFSPCNNTQEARERKSAAQLEKEARRKEHAQKVLRLQKGTSSAPSTTAPAPLLSTEDESKFQALFQKRTEGFIVDFMFRNAPPRPPVGPCFVGLGLDGELNDKWTRYKARNAIEVNHVWKLHVEPDVGVPLASAAMQLDLYVNPKNRLNSQANEDHPIDEDMFADGDDNKDPVLQTHPTMHPDDSALLDWKGSLGDTTGEALQLRRDYARAAARMQHRLPHGTTDKWSTLPSKGMAANRFKVKQSQGTGAFTSRVLQERNPFFMRKTTYLSNDTSQSVHAFKSLSQSRSHLMEESSKRLRGDQEKLPTHQFIEQAFDIAKQCAAFYSPATTTQHGTDEEEKREENLPPQKKARVHPTKKHVVAVAEYPLFPNTKTWDKTCIHVAMDHLPKKVGNTAPPSYAQMQKALIMDVRPKEKDLSTRMECNILVPKQVLSLPTKDSREKHDFATVHKYDLEVVHVKDDSLPLHNTFLFVMDKAQGVATYHPISSRVNLSSGRPISIQERNRKNTLYVRPVDSDEAQKGSKGKDKRSKLQDDDDDDDEMEEEKVGVKTSNRRRISSVLQDDSEDDE